MKIVTLITDFGNTDHYAGLLKGTLLSSYSQLNIIDISHNIEKFDIVHAAFILKSTYTKFPVDTIHIVNVSTFSEEKPRFILFKKSGHYFMGPDNGIFSLVFEGGVTEDIYRLEGGHEDVFAFRHAYAKAVEHIAREYPYKEIGTPQEDIERRLSLQPVVSNGQLRGTVIHIDHYGNAILNITKRLFEDTCQGRNFEMYFRRHDPITAVSQFYSDVPVGEILCLFNSSGHLEIALNMDRASEKYGLKVDDSIIIKWE